MSPSGPKLAEAVVTLVNLAALPLGRDTLARIAEKSRSVDAEVARWHDLAVSTGFAATA
jgi:hypothetical protein